jgi:hypothetical protein
MPDLTVDHDTRLGRFLLRNKVQKWRIPILAAKGGVKVLEAGTGRDLPLKGEGTHVSAGDTVRVVTPPPKPCQEALQREADDNWRDYAIVPGDTPYDKLMKEFLQYRTRTVLIADPFMHTLDGFLHGIGTSDEIVNPIRYLLIAGHASFSGALKIAMSTSPANAAFVRYEDLEDAVKKKTLVMDLDPMMPRPKGFNDPQVRLLGCTVGGQAPFMQKFKEALGGKVVVIAPKFLVFVDTVASPRGPLAYMGYDFSVYLPAPVKDQKALVAAMDAKSKLAEKNKDPRFVLRNGKAVPPASWNAWVPKDPNKTPVSRGGQQQLTEPLKIPNWVTLPVFRGRSNAQRRFAYNEANPFFGAPPGTPAGTTPPPVSIPLPKNTGKVEDWKKAVRADLEKRYRLFDPKHPLPQWVRSGYATMDEFMDGWDWQFKYDGGTKRLSFWPVRYEYRLWQPITTDPGNELVMNYYPKGKVPKKFAKLVPIEQLQVFDKFFFGVY